VAFLLVTMVWEEVGQLRLPDSMVDMMLAAQVVNLSDADLSRLDQCHTSGYKQVDWQPGVILPW